MSFLVDQIPRHCRGCTLGSPILTSLERRNALELLLNLGLRQQKVRLVALV